MNAVRIKREFSLCSDGFLTVILSYIAKYGLASMCSTALQQGSCYSPLTVRPWSPTHILQLQWSENDQCCRSSSVGGGMSIHLACEEYGVRRSDHVMANSPHNTRTSGSWQLCHWRHWGEECHRFCTKNPGKVVNQYNFSSIFKSA